MICSRCKEDKPAELFRKKGRQCRECVAAWHREHYTRTKEKHSEQGKRWRVANPERSYLHELRGRLKQYGITVEEYYEILKKQDHKCAVCKSADPKRKNARALFVDHCHATGRVRGLLCHRCNLAAGWFEDNTSNIDALRIYLSQV